MVQIWTAIKPILQPAEYQRITHRLFKSEENPRHETGWPTLLIRSLNRAKRAERRYCRYCEQRQKLRMEGRQEADLFLVSNTVLGHSSGKLREIRALSGDGL